MKQEWEVQVPLCCKGNTQRQGAWALPRFSPRKPHSNLVPPLKGNWLIKSPHHATINYPICTSPLVLKMRGNYISNKYMPPIIFITTQIPHAQSCRGWNKSSLLQTKGFLDPGLKMGFLSKFTVYKGVKKKSHIVGSVSFPKKETRDTLTELWCSSLLFLVWISFSTHILHLSLPYVLSWLLAVSRQKDLRKRLCLIDPMC